MKAPAVIIVKKEAKNITSNVPVPPEPIGTDLSANAMI